MSRKEVITITLDETIDPSDSDTEIITLDDSQDNISKEVITLDDSQDNLSDAVITLDDSQDNTSEADTTPGDSQDNISGQRWIPRAEQQLWEYVQGLPLEPKEYSQAVEMFYYQLDDFDLEVLKRYIGLVDANSQFNFGYVPPDLVKHKTNKRYNSESAISSALTSLIISRTRSEVFETAYQELLALYEVRQPQDLGMPSREEFFELVWKDLKKRLQYIFSFVRKNYY